MFSIIWPVHQLSEENVSGICVEWLVIQFLSVVSGICALLEEKSFYHFLTVDLFFHFHFIIVFCAVAYVSAIWRIYSSKELQRSF